MGKGSRGYSGSGNYMAQAMQAAQRLEAQQEREARRASRRSTARGPYRAQAKDDGTTHNFFGNGSEPHGHAVVSEEGELKYLRDEEGNEYPT